MIVFDILLGEYRLMFAAAFVIEYGVRQACCVEDT